MTACAIRPGLIGSSACLAGEIPSLLLEGDEEGACERASLYRDILGRATSTWNSCTTLSLNRPWRTRDSARVGTDGYSHHRHETMHIT
jgi:hypothetical protein